MTTVCKLPVSALSEALEARALWGCGQVVTRVLHDELDGKWYYYAVQFERGTHWIDVVSIVIGKRRTLDAITRAITPLLDDLARHGFEIVPGFNTDRF